MTENNADKAKDFAGDAAENIKDFSGDAMEQAKGLGSKIAGMFKPEK